MPHKNRAIPCGPPFTDGPYWLITPEAATGDPDVCWRWGGLYFGSNPEGYGTYFGFPAHRVAYKLWYGEDPGRFDVLHKCDHPWCINPYHLFKGNAKINAEDREAKGRHAHPGRPGRPRAKIDEDAVRDIRTSRRSVPFLMAKYDLTESWLYKIKSREAWKDVL